MSWSGASLSEVTFGDFLSGDPEQVREHAMSEIPISASVGVPPSPNKPDDVRIVQRLLAQVKPPLSLSVSETGAVDKNTLGAIREFQSRFMSHPDSRVDPDGRTIWHLNDGFVSNYINCNSGRRRTLDRDIITAQKWLDQVVGRLGAPDDDAKQKLKNIFHIEAGTQSYALHLLRLKDSYQKLRQSLDESFPLQCEAKPSVFGAWVVPGDSTMHFPPNHFSNSTDERTTRIIHERSHTIFQIEHDGMSGGGAVDFGVAPDDDNGFTYEQAIRNAYCYGWLARALQPGYVRPEDGEVITVKPR